MVCPEAREVCSEAAEVCSDVIKVCPEVTVLCSGADEASELAVLSPESTEVGSGLVVVD